VQRRLLSKSKTLPKSHVKPVKIENNINK